MHIDREKFLLWNSGPGELVSDQDAVNWAHPFVTSKRGTPPVDASDAQKVLAQRRITIRRKELELVPIVVQTSSGPMSIDVLDRTMTRIVSLRLSLPVYVDWKQDDNTFIRLTDDDIIAVYTALVDRQQRLFSLESAYLDLLECSTDLDAFQTRVEQFIPS